MFILGKEIKSIRDLTDAETKNVIERYTTGQACAKAQDGTLFLQQQRADVQIMSASLSKDAIRKFVEERKIKWDDAFEGRVKTYVASDESVDSYGDIIRQGGWNLKDRFTKNPAIMWVHDYEQPNIGAGISAAVADVSKLGKALTIDTLFMTQEMYPFADTVFKMVDGGFLKGGSVGFIPTKISYVDDADERKELGLGKYGVLFEKQILLEFSVCPLGANKNALVQNSLFADAARKGIITVDELKHITKDDNPQTRAPEGVRQTIDAALSLLAEKEISIPQAEEKTVIPYKKWPLADEDAAWDAAKEVSAADTEQLKVMGAWYDSENSDVKSSYKLPHHHADGYKTNWRAVANATARLGQANIPDADKEKLYNNHLKRHYADFGKEAPDYADLKALWEAVERVGLDADQALVLGQKPKEDDLKKIIEAIGELKESIAGTNAKINTLADTVQAMQGGDGGSEEPEQPDAELYADLFDKAKTINSQIKE